MKQTNTRQDSQSGSRVATPARFGGCFTPVFRSSRPCPADTTLTDAAVRAIVRKAYAAANIPIRLPMPSIDLHRQYWAFAIPITLL